MAGVEIKGTRTRVTIYPPAVESLFLGGGDVWNWMERVGRVNTMEAIREAPRRSGYLASQHNLALTPARLASGMTESTLTSAQWPHGTGTTPSTRSRSLARRRTIGSPAHAR
jgi:hypothetical protein